MLLSKIYYYWRKHGTKALIIKISSFPGQLQWLYKYDKWYKSNYSLTNEEEEKIKRHASSLQRKPVVSILMPTYNTPKKYLEMAIESVRGQLYPYWELCIADDASNDKEVSKILNYYQQMDPRIRVYWRKDNGHISEATNSALKIASGDYFALLDHDDLLVNTALYYAVLELNKYPETKLIYSDEDKLMPNNKLAYPYFKPSWNPDLLLSHNYISHLGIYEASLARKIGGFRKGYEGSQDYDFCLRYVENIHESQIRHIPFVLYHWRAIKGSTALGISEKTYASKAALNAIKDALRRRKVQARVEFANESQTSYKVRYNVSSNENKISLVILLERIIRKEMDNLATIVLNNSYKNIELIVSVKEEYLPQIENFNKLYPLKKIKHVPYIESDTFYETMLKSIKMVTGNAICFINGAIRCDNRNWLYELASHLYRENIGVVGPKIIDRFGFIYSAGVCNNEDGGLNNIFEGSYKLNIGYMGRASLIQNYSVINHSCFAIEKILFDKVGGFDKNYTSQEYAVADLCMRIENIGYRNIYNPNSSVTIYRQNKKYLKKNNDQQIYKKNHVNTDGIKYDLNPNIEISSGNIVLKPNVKTMKPWAIKH